MSNFAKMAIAASAALMPASAVATDAKVVFVKCKWNNGNEGYFKITENSWSFWDSQAWSWADLECKEAGFSNDGRDDGPNGFSNYELNCATEFNDQTFTWTMDGLSLASIERPSGGFERRLHKSYTINRQTGTIMYNYKVNEEAWGRYTASDKEDHGAGLCDRTTDLALQPRPAPPPPRL